MQTRSFPGGLGPVPIAIEVLARARVLVLSQGVGETLVTISSAVSMMRYSPIGTPQDLLVGPSPGVVLGAGSADNDVSDRPNHVGGDGPVHHPAERLGRGHDDYVAKDIVGAAYNDLYRAFLDRAIVPQLASNSLQFPPGTPSTRSFYSGPRTA